MLLNGGEEELFGFSFGDRPWVRMAVGGWDDDMGASEAKDARWTNSNRTDRLELLQRQAICDR